MPDDLAIRLVGLERKALNGMVVDDEFTEVGRIGGMKCFPGD